LALGVIFVMHGAQKVLGLFGGHGLQATVQNFEAGLGIPPHFGYAAAFTEFFGGIALLLGLLTRIAALGIGTVMAVAMWKVHLANGFFLNFNCEAGKGHGIEYNVALLAIALALVLTGGGAYSIDRKITG
jgi:putative oxidoreductase